MILDGGQDEFEFRLIGRNPEKLEALAAVLGNDTRWQTVTTMDVSVVSRTVADSDIVVNVAGPFAGTARTVARAAMTVGAAYVDIANERDAVQSILDLSPEAEHAGVTLLPASGYGTVATEGLVAWLADGEPIKSVELALLPDNGGRSAGALESVLLGLAAGGARVIGGRYARESLGTGARRLRLPDGKQLTLIPADLGDLASVPSGYGATEVSASVGVGIPPNVARAVLPLVSRAMRSSRLRTRLSARSPSESDSSPRAYVSRTWARVGLENGESREGWMAAGEGYEFTANAVLGVARRVAAGSAQPGARTAIREFGPDFLTSLPGVTLTMTAGSAVRAQTQ
jgi:short subunit dehydrogenase-like uncharacterized protein